MLGWKHYLKHQQTEMVISGEGKFVAKRFHVVIITFTLLEEGSLSKSAHGNCCLAILKLPEKYDSLSSALVDLTAEIERLKNITVNNPIFDIEYFLGGDYKFLAMAVDINSAISEHSCVWCKSPKCEKTELDKWSMFDTDHPARTLK